MLRRRNPFFLSLVVSVLCVAGTAGIAGCRWFGDGAAPGPAPVPAVRSQAESGGRVDAARVAQLIRGLGDESVVAGNPAGTVQLFQGEFDRHVCEAADQLAAMGKEVAPDLRRATHDADPIVRRNAAMVLAQLGDASAVGVLYETAEQESLRPLIRGKAIDRLVDLARQSDDRSSILDFQRLMNLFHQRKRATDASRHIRTAILRAAAVTDDPQGRNVLLAMLNSNDPALLHAALEALGDVQMTETPPAVVQALNDRNPRIVLAAMGTLGRWGGDEMTRRYGQLLASSDEKVRLAAVKQMALAPSQDAGQLLVKLLGDPSLTVQREVVATAEKIGETGVLEQALKIPRWRIRKAAVEALGRMKSVRSLGALAALTGDDSYNVRQALAVALGDMGSPTAASTLVELLSDSAASVREAAAESFERASGVELKDYDPLQQPWKNAEAIDRARAWAAEHGSATSSSSSDNGGDAAATTIDPETRRLIDALALPPGEHRQLAVASLVRMKEAALPALEASADSREPEIVTAILDDVLPAIDPLYAALKQLRSSDETARRQAAIHFSIAAKGRRLPQAAWMRAREALSSETDGQVRRMLAERLYEAGCEGLDDTLVHGLKLEDPRSRQSAALLLGRLKSLKAVPHLVEALKDERTNVQYAAAWALGEIGDQAAVEPLKLALRTPDMPGRLAFGAALAKLGRQIGRDELIRIMDETTTAMQVQAAEAMGDAPHVDYVPTLVQRLSETNPRLTAAATEALRKITGQDFGYRPYASAAVRSKALADWRQWYARSQQVRTPHP
ncbi:MAG: HEAT repeat domain-containing protein [Planctomycetes bacterium]|nr:HEAT repeat domain-containing protein [Planctomycetota bacterium]